MILVYLVQGRSDESNISKRKQKYLKINQNGACIYRIKPDKANEWPLMSTPINKEMLKIVAGTGNETMRKSETRSLRWLYLECSLVNPKVVSLLAPFSPSWIYKIYHFFYSLSYVSCSLLHLLRSSPTPKWNAQLISVQRGVYRDLTSYS